MAKDWAKEKSAMDMARVSLADKHNAEVPAEYQRKADEMRKESDYLETLSSKLKLAIDYFRNLEIEGVNCQQRKSTIDFLISADSEIHLQIIELKRHIRKLESD